MDLELLITICAHRSVSAPTTACLENLRCEPPCPYGLALLVGDALISRSRSQGCSKFLLESKIPYMLFVDEDILFDPKDVAKIYNHLKNGYDVIGGIYAVRGASQLSSYGYGGKLEVDGKVHEIEYLATGFMGISRRILEKIVKRLKLPYLNPNDWSKCYPFFECGRRLKRSRGGDPIYISEDWDFCDKVRAVGDKIYADTSVQLGHIREQIYTPEHVKQQQTQAQIQQRVYGSLDAQAGLMQKVDEDLGEFLGWSKEAVQEEMRVAQKKLADMWKLHKGSNDDFYKNNTEYLFDLAVFNQFPLYYQQRIGQLVNISKIKMLDIGCGIGTAVFMMAGQGCEAVGWDINEKCIDFCKFKKKKHNLGGEFITEKPDYSQFDLIIAVDTLEHIENLGEFLFDLGKQMKTGAKFYHSDYFPREEAWPMHFEEHKEHLSEWLKEGDFIEWDGNWAIRT